MIDWHGKGVLCTGADGFIGGHLQRKLSRLGCYSHGTLGSMPDDIRDPLIVEKLFLDTCPKIIFHLAAQAIVGKAEAGTKECLETNIMGTVNILEVCRRNDKWIEAVVVASSDKAYGRSPPPYREDGTPLDPVNPYDTSKACQDMIARCYAETYGLPVTVTRCSNVYGPGDLNWSRLIPYTARCLIKGEKPVFHSGLGGVYKEWIYVDDVVDAYILLAEKIAETKGKAYNIGSGIVLTRDEVVHRILGGDAPIMEEAVGFRELGSQSLDSSRIRALGWKPKVSFNEGLRRTLEWYKQDLGGQSKTV